MAPEKEIKLYTYFYAPFVRKWMALRGLANADELLLLKCNSEMLYHCNKVWGRCRGNMAVTKTKEKKRNKEKQRKKADQSRDGVWDVSSGMTLANAAKAKLVAKDPVWSNQHLVQNQGVVFLSFTLVQSVAAHFLSYSAD